jgi:hypothetical protein
MTQYGMELAPACEVIFDGLLAGKFWIDTQPDMTRDIVESRAAYLTARQAPELTPMAKSILGIQEAAE